MGVELSRHKPNWCFYLLQCVGFIIQNKAWQPTPHISFCFSKNSQFCSVCEDTTVREGYRQKEREKERRGRCWPTFHSSLCTVGQAMSAERLESLCNTPPHGSSWFVKIKYAIAFLLLSTSIAYDVVRLTFGVRSFSSSVFSVLFPPLTENTCESVHLEKAMWQGSSHLFPWLNARYDQTGQQKWRGGARS